SLSQFSRSPASNRRVDRLPPADRYPSYRKPCRSIGQGDLLPQGHRIRHPGRLPRHPPPPQKQMMMARGAEKVLDIEERRKNGIATPTPPQRVTTSPAREVVMKGDD